MPDSCHRLQQRATCLLFAAILTPSFLWAQTPNPKSPKPDPTSFTTWEEYSDALVQWKIDQQIGPLKEKIALLELDTRLFWQWKSHFPAPSAVIDTADPPAFHWVHVDGTVFLIMLKSIDRYLDGVKVFLDIGNPSSMTVNRYKLYCSWWKHPPAGTDILAGRHSGGLRSQEMSSFPLREGSWTPIEIVIPSVDPAVFGVVEIQLTEVHNVTLRR